MTKKQLKEAIEKAKKKVDEIEKNEEMATEWYAEAMSNLSMLEQQLKDNEYDDYEW